MKYLVTGGAGFIGSNLVDYLCQLGHEVIVIDDLSSGKKEYINPKAKFYKKDISSMRRESDYSLFEGVSVVFHLAAKAEVDPSIKNPLPFHDVNINGTLNVLMACREKKVKRIVYSASSSCYGNPTQIPTTEQAEINPMSPYALQKLTGEEYCKLFSKLYDLESVCLRYFNVYGPRQRDEGAYSLVTGIFMRQHDNGESLTVTGDGEQKRDFVSVQDVVEANVLASQSDKVGKGESINIGNGEAITINELAKSISDDIVYVEKRYEPDITLANISKAKKLLKWNPMVSFKTWITNYRREHEQTI